MVEFAIVAVVFFIPLIFGIIEFGRMAWTKTTLTAAAREGVRYAIVHGSTSPAPADSAAVADYVKGRTPLGGIAVRTRWMGGNSPTDTVQVTVTYPFNSLIPVVQTRQLQGVSQQVIAY
jgi:Flp pilus assembly protein TadG